MNQLDHLKVTFLKLERLLVFRKIIQDNILGRIESLVKSLDSSLSEEDINLYYQLCYELIAIAEKDAVQDDLLKSYILKLVVTDKNIFSISCEKSASKLGPSLQQLVLHDLAILKDIFKFNLTDLGSVIGAENLELLNNYSTDQKENIANSFRRNYNKLRQSFLKGKPEDILQTLIKYYNTAGCGELCLFSSFRWESEQGLQGVVDSNSIKFGDLVGYDQQKDKLIENTLTFLQGKTANNVLLYGDSGTGKSSSIRALINEFSAKGLRLVEVTKEQIKCIPRILARLRKRGLYFIIFMDDLSFEDFETDYKYLKAVMEGGVEGKPDNIIFYATTNRRHLIKENWQDRNGFSDVHQLDAQQEKLSLAERFGITITYLSPDQQQYLEIIKGLAVKNSLHIPEDELVDMALKWEKWHHGRSGRTARQFINYLSGKNTR